MTGADLTPVPEFFSILRARESYIDYCGRAMRAKRTPMPFGSWTATATRRSGETIWRTKARSDEAGKPPCAGCDGRGFHRTRSNDPALDGLIVDCVVCGGRGWLE